MARERKRRPERDDYINTNVPSEAARAVYLPSLPKSSLTDLRFFQPVRPKVAFDDVGRRARVLQTPVNVNKIRPRSAGVRSSKLLAGLERQFRERLSFAVSQRVLVCVRRKARREVLFAKRRTGRGSRSRKRRNFFSDVRC